MIKSKQTAIPLHTVPNYYEKAFSLLNQEWERKDDSWYIIIILSTNDKLINVIKDDKHKKLQ